MDEHDAPPASPITAILIVTGLVVLWFMGGYNVSKGWLTFTQTSPNPASSLSQTAKVTLPSFNVPPINRDNGGQSNAGSAVVSSTDIEALYRNTHRQ